MFRKTLTGITLLATMGLFLGQQTPTQAQTPSPTQAAMKVATIVGWAGNNNVTTLLPNIQATDNGTQAGGSFNVVGYLTNKAQWTVVGNVHALSFSKDAVGQHATVIGYTYYTGGAMKNFPALSTLTITIQPSGKVLTSVKVANFFTGALLASSSSTPASNASLSGVLPEMPLIKGSAKLAP